MQKIDFKNIFILALIVLAVVSRLLPHEYNFSPLGAIALFGAAHFSKRYLAIFVPLLAAFISDLYLNNVVYGAQESSFVWFYQGFYWVYGSYALTALLGFYLFTRINVSRIAVGALGSAVLFFLITNFACWPGNPLYTQDFSGLMACYSAGLPFFRGTLLGNVLYSALLFGIYHWVSIRYFAKEAQIKTA